MGSPALGGCRWPCSQPGPALPVPTESRAGRTGLGGVSSHGGVAATAPAAAWGAGRAARPRSTRGARHDECGRRGSESPRRGAIPAPFGAAGAPALDHSQAGTPPRHGVPREPGPHPRRAKPQRTRPRLASPLTACGERAVGLRALCRSREGSALSVPGPGGERCPAETGTEPAAGAPCRFPGRRGVPR